MTVRLMDRLVMHVLYPEKTCRTVAGFKSEAAGFTSEHPAD
jgi:hypothetical protein